jgi:shikimate kinase
MASVSNIVLIGMPGVGKTTLGVLLAEQLGRAFMDTDIYLQLREGRKLQTIIDYDGLDRFRQIEEKTILSIGVKSHVIATGGSVVYSPAAMQHLHSDGIICYLELNPKLLRQRLHNLATRGIAMATGQSIAALFEERRPLYERYADVSVVCDNNPPDVILERLMSCLPDFDRV